MGFNISIKKPKVLVVDDDPANLQVLGRILHDHGLDVSLAADAVQALRSLEFRIPNVFLLDVMMPGVDGYELAFKLKAMPETENKPIIFLSALEDTESKIKAFDSGGSDYITKPFSPKEVIARVFNQLELEEYRSRMEDRVREQVLQIEAITMSLVEVLENANYYRDDETGLHIRRVTEYARILADQIPLAERHRKEIVLYTSLHDIGKVGIPDTILRKPERLSGDEWEVMKRHPDIGFRILDKPAIPSTAKNIVLHHHERWDGSGYPGGLKQAAIPIEARIIAMADVYDALRSKRVYKNAFSREETEAVILGEKGKHFDPMLVDAFCRRKDAFDTAFTTLMD